jgi:hypothetical protein
MTVSDAGEAPRVKPGAGVAVPLNEMFCVARALLRALSIRTREPLSAPAVRGEKSIVRVQLAFAGSAVSAAQSVVC